MSVSEKKHRENWIDDAGEKIGGARKDIVAARRRGGLTLEDVTNWDFDERMTYINKNEVFVSVDFKALLDSGEYSRNALYAIKKIRDALPSEPLYSGRTKYMSDFEKRTWINAAQNAYLNIVSDIRDIALKIHTDEQIYHAVLKISSMIKETTNKHNEVHYMSSHLYDDRAKMETELECLNLLGEKNKFYKMITSSTMRSVDYLNDKCEEAGFLMDDIEKQVKRRYFIAKYDGEGIRLPSYTVYTDENGKEKKQYASHTMKMKPDGMRKTSYTILNVNEYYLNPDHWKMNTYAVIEHNSGVIHKNNFETKEAAIAFAAEKEGLYDKKVSAGKKHKNEILPPQLKNINREGENYRDGKDISSTELMNYFGLRAVEYGESVPQKERVAFNNFCYDAMRDLAKALNIADSDVSLGNRLALGFGSRGTGGRGAAVAHYEPDKNAINLTRQRGAGSLGHEWGHALDRYIALCTYSTAKYSTSVAMSLTARVVNVMKYGKEEGGYSCNTQYYRDARMLDRYESRKKPYWATDVELFARAFATYLLDKISPEKSDYLCGHAEMSPIEIKGQNVYTYPVGNERKAINEAFDKMLEEVKELGFLHHDEHIQKQEKEQIPTDTLSNEAVYDSKNYDLDSKDKYLMILDDFSALLSNPTEFYKADSILNGLRDICEKYEYFSDFIEEKLSIGIAAAESADTRIEFLKVSDQIFTSLSMSLCEISSANIDKETKQNILDEFYAMDEFENVYSYTKPNEQLSFFGFINDSEEEKITDKEEIEVAAQELINDK